MRIKRWCAALFAVTWMLLAAAAPAQETAPLAPQSQQEANGGERLHPFGLRRDYLGVKASSKWLYQVKLGGRLLNMRMFTPDGEQITFQEKLTAARTGGEDICLMLHGGRYENHLLLLMDQDAVNTLLRLGITEIVVADYDLTVQARYMTADLAALRSMFSVGEHELLCVSGETQPVTVVSVDGVRRHITK